MENKSQAVKEYRQAFDESFKDKPEPKDEKESKKRLEEFFHWYSSIGIIMLENNLILEKLLLRCIRKYTEKRHLSQ